MLFVFVSNSEPASSRLHFACRRNNLEACQDYSFFFIAGATLCASVLYNIVAGAPFCDVAKAMSKVVARTAFCGAF